jgi:protein TonB
VVDVVIKKGVNPSLDKEALRIVMSSPKWEPGKQRGKPVKVQFTFPINFVL